MALDDHRRPAFCHRPALCAATHRRSELWSRAAHQDHSRGQTDHPIPRRRLIGTIRTCVRYTAAMVGCLLIRSFALACELAEHRELAGLPAAVADGGLLEAVSPEAEAQAVRPGQAAREAVGHCPTLALLEARPARYQAVWQDVLQAVENVAFTFEPSAQGLVYVALDELLTYSRALDAVMVALLRCAPSTLEPRMG